MSPEIKIKNYIMTKKIEDFMDYRPSYFNKFRAKRNILLEQFYELFGDYLIENSYYSIKSSYDLIINDFKEDIYCKEVIRDFVIIEFQNKQVLVYFGDYTQIDLREIGGYVVKEHPKFAIFKLQILETYSLEELQIYFKLQYRQTNTLRVIDLIIKLFARQTKIKSIGNEEEKFTSLFGKNNIELLKQYDFENYIYFNDDYKLNHKDLVNLASVGSTGSGKTYTLNLLLLQILFGGNFRRIIYFDTQNSFNETMMNNINPIYQNKCNYLQEGYFQITDKNFYLSELDFVMSVNFLLEVKGYGGADAKASVVQVEYDNHETFKQAVSEILKIEKEKLSVFKDLNKLEDLDAIDKFMKKVKIRKSGSIFDDLETRKQFFAIFTFQDTFFYEVACYLYLQKFKDILYSRDDKCTYLFADETQKYLGGAFLKKILLDLVKEKRQFGFRFFYTGLSYADVGDFMKFTRHRIFNSFNDVYMKNQLVSTSSTPITSLRMPFEKVVSNNDTSETKKVELNLNLVTKTKNNKQLLNEVRDELSQDEIDVIEHKIDENKKTESFNKKKPVVDEDNNDWVEV
ncbi:MAG: hypothetical protein PF569_10275 [Candidatus Woesearchaeota archaeon]|nr:hypothetical protein [Candidatus Woesearchaeota archaeon]